MTPKQLEKCGQAMFTDWSWKTDLAKSINVSRITVNRWAKGLFKMTNEKDDAVIKAMEDKMQKLGLAIKKAKNDRQQKTGN